MCQPVRWARVLRPEWIVLEEVPAVASLWEHFALIFAGWGYRVWTGDLCAADYGVPQTRTRRILIASRVRVVGPPAATHAEYPEGPDLFGGPGRARWVTMAGALGWGLPGRTVNTRGDRASTGGNEFDPTVGPSWAVTEKTRSWQLRAGNRASASVRAVSEPAPTLLFGNALNDVSWHHDGEKTRITVEEAATLQGFRTGYPWRGARTSRFRQIGNAVPPPLAAHVIAAATGRPAPQMAR